MAITFVAVNSWIKISRIQMLVGKFREFVGSFRFPNLAETNAQTDISLVKSTMAVCLNCFQDIYTSYLLPLLSTYNYKER